LQKIKKREKILNCAAETISRLGYANTSIGVIAKHLGVSKGLINYYFPSKELLMKAIVNEVYVQAASYMESTYEENNNAAETLCWYIESCLFWLQSNKLLVSAAQEIILNLRDEHGGLVYKTTDESIYKPIIEILMYGQADGSFRNFDEDSAKVMAMVIRNAIDGASGKFINDPTFDLQKYTITLIDIVKHATQAIN
jgi:AcrR family transcriptional regulator